MNIKEYKSYQCGKCGRIYIDKNLAEKCCIQNKCKICNKNIERYRSYCFDCLEEIRFEKAKKIKYKDYKIKKLYDVFSDKFFEDYEDLCDYYSGNYIIKNIPIYVYACEKISFKINIENSIEPAIEEMYEDFDDIVNEKELRDFIENWNKKQTAKAYEPNFKKIILLNAKTKNKKYINMPSQNN